MARLRGKWTGKRWDRGSSRRGVSRALAIALIWWIPSAAIAQVQVDTETVDTGAGAEEARRAAAAVEALEEARAAVAGAADRDVTFAEVLADPDNVALNFSYAKSQVRKGRLKSAATTLERILLLHPDLHEVRLFYALVLIRLDSLETAERELRRLETLSMEDGLRAELERLLDQIADRRSRWRVSLLTGVGANYDWNVNSVPYDRIRLFGGVPASLDDGSDRIGDFSFTGFAQWDMAYDLGYQARHEVIGSLLYYIDDQVIHDPLDISSFGFDAGVRLRFPGVTLTPTIGRTVLRLSREQYYTAHEAKLAVEVPLPPDMELFGDIGYSRERYYLISESISGPDQNGPLVDGRIGVEYDLDQRNRVTGIYDFSLKRGKPLHEHRWQHGVQVSHLFLFEHGGFLNSSLKVTQNQEYRPDPGEHPDRKRRDITYKVRIGYGAPIGRLVDLDWLAPGLENAVGNTVASVTGEYYKNTSTIRNFRYENRRGEVLLTRKWTF
jgi:tetratricopeptide (TPR) repeat protein